MTITLGARTSTYEFWRGTILSIAPGEVHCRKIIEINWKEVKNIVEKEKTSYDAYSEFFKSLTLR